jgi:hypothetical protein
MMNHGYFFIIMCWLLLILILTQWLDPFLKGFNPSAKIKRNVVLFLLALVILQGINVPISPQISVNLGSIGLLGSIFLYFFWQDQTGLRLHMLCVILFLGVFYAVLYELFLIDPILMVISPFYLLPAFLVLFLLFTTRDLKLQIIMLLGGLLLGELMHKVFLLKHVPHVWLGDAEFRDQMMLGFILATFISVQLKVIQRIYQQAIRYLTTFRKQEG